MASTGTTPSSSPSPPGTATAPSVAAKGAVASKPSHQFCSLGKETLVAFPVSTGSTGTRTLLRTVSGDAYLPGQPRIRLHATAGAPSAPPARDTVADYLREAHLTNELDELLPFMSYVFVQTPSFRHIMPLHHQQAHARNIIVDEAAGLHLVWHYDRIFIKPIPAYFYSSQFWTYLQGLSPAPNPADNRKFNDPYAAAIGFMRSYYFLIQFEVDFDLACERKLVPKLPGEDKHPTYAEFCRFIEQFNDISDADTCRRYHYGELRLTRINRTSLFRKGRLAYFHIYPQWGSYLRHFLAPIIMILGGFSVVLNAMQVTLNAQEMLGEPSEAFDLGPQWSYFTRVSLYFPVVIIVTIASILALSLIGVAVMAGGDLYWAKTTRRKKRNGDPDAGNRSHGVVW